MVASRLSSQAVAFTLTFPIRYFIEPLKVAHSFSTRLLVICATFKWFVHKFRRIHGE